jgi:hypothetical protein
MIVGSFEESFAFKVYLTPAVGDGAVPIPI